MTDQHPITTPLELELQWEEDWLDLEVKHKEFGPYMADRGAQWGYDQRGEVNEAKLQQARDEELEACCEWLADETPANYIDALRDARRPKPSKQAEKALNHFELFSATFEVSGGDSDLIRRALERLKQLEDN